MFKKLQGNKKGFTLIELIIVIAILGVLVTLAAPKFSGFIAESHVTAMKADVKVLEDSIMVLEANGDGQSVVIDTKAPVETATIDGKTVNKLDGAANEALKTNIKNLKNSFEDYGITADNEVYHMKGIKDSKGQVHHSVNFSTPVLP